jgi:hypothetical protein
VVCWLVVSVRVHQVSCTYPPCSPRLRVHRSQFLEYQGPWWTHMTQSWDHHRRLTGWSRRVPVDNGHLIFAFPHYVATVPEIWQPIGVSVPSLHAHTRASSHLEHTHRTPWWYRHPVHTAYPSHSQPRRSAWIHRDMSGNSPLLQWSWQVFLLTRSASRVRARRPEILHYPSK